MKNSRIFLLIVLGTIVGCKKDDSPIATNPIADNRSIMPLKIGNRWMGTFALYDSTGRITYSSDTLLVTLFAIERDTIIQGERWYVTSGASLPPTSFHPSLLLTARADGLWGRPNNTSSSGSYLIAKFPCSLNDSYVTGKDSNYRATLLSTNSSVSVPRGMYSCYQYRVSDRNNLSDYKSAYFMYPDSGFIRVDQYARMSTGQCYVNASVFLKTLVLN
jgi:hypothetical protein